MHLSSSLNLLTSVTGEGGRVYVYVGERATEGERQDYFIVRERV